MNTIAKMTTDEKIARIEAMPKIELIGRFKSDYDGGFNHHILPDHLRGYSEYEEFGKIEGIPVAMYWLFSDAELDALDINTYGFEKLSFDVDHFDRVEIQHDDID